MCTISTMTDQPDDVIDCQTCLAANTTACADCIVGHLLANDDGPIELRVVAGHRPDDESAQVDPADAAVDRAVALFDRAGLLDSPPAFVSVSDFERGRVPERVVT